MADLIKLDADLDIIQKLDDEPNDVGGLSSAELKAEFDKAGNAIKTYLNDTLIPGIEGTGGEGGLVGEQIAAHNVAPDAHADIRQEIADNKAAADQAIALKLDSATIKSEGIPEIVSPETLRTYFYGKRKETSRSWQFEVSPGNNENMVSALGGFPNEHTAAEKWFLYIDLPYTEAGGFVIHAQLEGRDNGLLYRQDQFATLDQRWHTTGWIQIQDVQKHLDTHISDQSNPHKVTPEQIGAVKAPAAPGTEGQILTQAASGETKWAPHAIIFDAEDEGINWPELNDFRTKTTFLSPELLRRFVGAIEDFRVLGTPVILKHDALPDRYEGKRAVCCALTSVTERLNGLGGFPERKFKYELLFISTAISLDSFEPESNAQYFAVEITGEKDFTEGLFDMSRKQAQIPTPRCNDYVLMSDVSVGGEWKPLPKEIPTGGTDGQVLTQTSTGTPEWKDISGGAEAEKWATEKVAEAISSITDEGTFRTYFYNLRKSQTRKYQFEISPGGIHENIVTGVGGRPQGVSADDSAFIYVEIPFSEAGGYVIHVTYELRSRAGIWEKDIYGTLDSRWQDTGWYEQNAVNAPTHTIMNVDIEDDGFGGYETIQYNDNDINNHRNAGGLVQAKYYDSKTNQTYTYYYSTMESDRKPTFVRTYVDPVSGKVVQILASVGNDRKVTLVRRESTGGGGGGAGDAITVPTTLTVGAGGDHATLNEAIGVISAKYPIYKAGGLKVEVKILAGTTINEQISVVQNDLQFITITAEDAEVPVDSTGWTTQGLDAHDLRDDVPFFGGENAAKLPTIGCKFKLVTKGATPAVGCFANRGSSGVILAGCGFDGFNDGIIANNESSVTAREAICTNMARWGIHARHNGEISARSIDVSGAGVYAAYADRIADIDIRYATLSKSDTAIYANNCSRINANSAIAYYCPGSSSKGLVCAASASVINADKMDIQFVDHGPVFKVGDGSVVNAIGAITPALKPETPRTSQTPGVMTRDGMIFDDASGVPEGQFCVSDGMGGTKFITLGDAAKEAL